MPERHALLSASSSHRWLNCTPSARLEEQFPNTSTVYAAEGTYCHSLGEQKIRQYLGERVKRQESEEFDTDEIDQISDTYSQFVIETLEGLKKNGPALLMAEEQVDYSDIAPGGFGTSDAVIIGKDEQGRGALHIVDLKTGRGVFVDVKDNPQLKLYAYGSYRKYGYIYDIEIVRMSIVQPRLENIGTFEMTADDLVAWCESIKDTAKAAYEGSGDQHPGEWCRFCRARAVCKACADEAMNLVKEEFVDMDAGVPVLSTESSSDADKPAIPVFKQPCLIPFHSLTDLLPTLNRISSWIEAVFAYVSSEAINNGVEVDGYKVVEGRSRRQFTSTTDVEKAAANAGITDIYRTELKSLTELEKAVGKKRFTEIFASCIVKPRGKLTLVPEDDPRPAADLTDAHEEFQTLTEE